MISNLFNSVDKISKQVLLTAWNKTIKCINQPVGSFVVKNYSEDDIVKEKTTNNINQHKLAYKIQ